MSRLQDQHKSVFRCSSFGNRQNWLLKLAGFFQPELQDLGISVFVFHLTGHNSKYLPGILIQPVGNRALLATMSHVSPPSELKLMAREYWSLYDRIFITNIPSESSVTWLSLHPGFIDSLRFHVSP